MMFQPSVKTAQVSVNSIYLYSKLYNAMKFFSKYYLCHYCRNVLQKSSYHAQLKILTVRRQTSWLLPVWPLGLNQGPPKTTRAYISDQSGPELTSRFQVRRTYHSGVACFRDFLIILFFLPCQSLAVNKFHCYLIFLSKFPLRQPILNLSVFHKARLLDLQPFCKSTFPARTCKSVDQPDQQTDHEIEPGILTNR